MRPGICQGLAALAICLSAGCLHAPSSWSPDSRWIAYTTALSQKSRLVSPGWILEGTRPSKVIAPAERSKFRRYRLWASKAEGNESICLLDSTEPISSPGWSPDGKALVVCRIVAEADGRKALETLVIDGPDRRRVLVREPIDPFRVEVELLPKFAPAWSPDGTLLAVPRIQPMGLAVVRVDTGRVLKTIEDASLPAWSPDGGKLAFIKRGISERLGVIEPRSGAPRDLIDLGLADQAPLWTKDGSMIVAASRMPRERGLQGRVGGSVGTLIRIRADNGQVDSIRALSDDRLPGVESDLGGLSFTLDREGDNLFHTAVRPDAPSVITWFRPRENMVLRKFPAIDYSIPLGGLSVTPSSSLLAVRMGGPDRLLPPVILDLERAGDTLRTPAKALVPDDDSRIEWITLLSRTAQTLLAGSRSARTPKAPFANSPSPVPYPGEFTGESEISFRLRKIARVGREVCRRPEATEPAPPELLEVIDEARLYFEMLAGDFTAALESLERLERREGSSRRNLTLLGLRAQIALSTGDFDQFELTTRLIARVEPPSISRRLEIGGGVARLIETPSGQALWSETLREARSLIEHADVQEMNDANVPQEVLRIGAPLDPFRLPPPFLPK